MGLAECYRRNEKFSKIFDYTQKVIDKNERSLAPQILNGLAFIGKGKKKEDGLLMREGI